MNPSPADPAHVLFLMSDTGGGHRSAAEAIIEAIQIEFGERMTAEMVDIFKEYAPPPLDLAPTLYPQMARLPQAWQLGYRLSDGVRRERAFTMLLSPYMQRAIRRAAAEHPADLIVSVHQLMNGPVLRALGPNRPPFLTVVTDMVSTHAFWYNRQADRILVPTEEARQRGIHCGVDPAKIQVVGQPVAQRFTQPAGDRRELRARLGWPQDKPVVVLVGGGEGMGPLEATALAIDASRMPIALMVICGRNRRLKERLEAHRWNIEHHIYGFVREMPDFMRAADVLITKAGPGTISEAFIAGLPLILYSRMPGQEDGNVDYVVDQRAGVWAPRPEQVVATLYHWLIDRPDRRAQVAERCKALARPDASNKIARVIGQMLNVPVQPVDPV